MGEKSPKIATKQAMFTFWVDKSLLKMSHLDFFNFGIIPSIFITIKHSSLHSPCWMRLFLWFSNTVNCPSFAFLQNVKILLILWFFTETTVDSPDMSYVLKPPPSLNRPTPSAPQPDTPLPPRRRTVSFHSPPPNYSFVEATNAQ